jgi:hypothetical protein
MKTNGKIFKVGTSAILLSAFILSCSTKEKNDNKNTLALLLLANRNSTTTGTRAQVRQASAGRAAGRSAASSARGAARTSFFIDIKKGDIRRQLNNRIHERLSGNYFFSTPGQPQKASTRMTAITCATSTGGACTDNSTSVVISGSSTCTNGGTTSFSSLGMTLSGATQDSLELNMTSGSISFSTCGLEASDFANYPATTRVQFKSGSIEPRGTYKATDTTTGTITETKTVESITVNGTVVLGDNSSLVLKDVKSVTNLTEKIDANDIKFFKQNGTALTSDEVAALFTNFDFSSVFGIGGKVIADGTLVMTGLVNGESAGANIALSNKTITWSVKCSKNFNDMTDADWASDTVCTFTTN